MKKGLLTCLVCFCLTPAFCSSIDSLLGVLDRSIEQRPATLQQKYRRIADLRSELARSGNRQDSFQLILRLTNEYRSFNYDTAYLEVQRLRKVAATGHEQLQAGILEAFVLLSSGLFREAIDELNELSIQGSPDSIRAQYHFNLARSYFDLADAYTGYLNNEGQFQSGLQYLEAAIDATAGSSAERLSFEALRALKLGRREASKRLYQNLIERPDITTRQLAIEYSALSSLYRNTDPDSSLIFLIKAAIADERASVKESTALTNLANHFFQEKEFERASRYINLALADANFFGAQHRKMQILHSLPLIENQRLELERSKYRQFVFFSATLAVLLLFSLLLIIRTQRQKRQIDLQNRQINAQNQKLIERETAIRRAYQKLEDYAQELSESNQLKEKYIGHFFESNTNLINKVHALFSGALKQVREGKFKEAIYSLQQFNDDYEKKRLLQDFDATFLTVFPSFIEQINRFFPETERFEMPPPNTLSTELRIFALIRLGISNNHTIARIHNFSVNTIYAYKTRIRNKSSLSNDEFDQAILGIRTIWDDPAAETGSPGT
ncbi:MAG: hypothetical protein KDC43_23965 [Saprospiraceae bacterium]|nr:hypothetical protein [Saprospiraceae bacterium]